VEGSKEVRVHAAELGEGRLEGSVTGSKDVFDVGLGLCVCRVVGDLESLLFLSSVGCRLALCGLGPESQQFDQSSITSFSRTTCRGKCLGIGAERGIDALVVARVLDKGVFEGAGRGGTCGLDFGLVVEVRLKECDSGGKRRKTVGTRLLQGLLDGRNTIPDLRHAVSRLFKRGIHSTLGSTILLPRKGVWNKML